MSETCPQRVCSITPCPVFFAAALASAGAFFRPARPLLRRQKSAAPAGTVTAQGRCFCTKGNSGDDHETSSQGGCRERAADARRHARARTNERANDAIGLAEQGGTRSATAGSWQAGYEREHGHRVASDRTALQ